MGGVYAQANFLLKIQNRLWLILRNLIPLKF